MLRAAGRRAPCPLLADLRDGGRCAARLGGFGPDPARQPAGRAPVRLLRQRTTRAVDRGPDPAALSPCASPASHALPETPVRAADGAEPVALGLAPRRSRISGRDQPEPAAARRRDLHLCKRARCQRAAPRADRVVAGAPDPGDRGLRPPCAIQPGSRLDPERSLSARSAESRSARRAAASARREQARTRDRRRQRQYR